MYLLHTAGGISHNLTGNIDDAIQCGIILTIVFTQLRLAKIEMNEQSVLLFTEDTGTIVGPILGDMSYHLIVLLKLTSPTFEFRNW